MRKSRFLKFSPLYLFLLSLPAGLFMLYASGDIFNVPDTSLFQTADAARYYSRLDGRSLPSSNTENGQVVAVVIDNHPDTRPQTGLGRAKVVYEVPVEGFITRYLAIFDSKQKVPAVGPVRSARPYFLDWVREYGGALFLHSGGSPAALDLIKERSIFDGNEFFWGKYFWRTPERTAPHNLYTNSANWQNMIIDRTREKTKTFSPAGAWKYARVLGKGAASPVKEVSVKYSSSYQVSWKYDQNKLEYARYINGSKDIDKNGAEIRVRNLIVQETAIEVIDGEGRLDIKTIGAGKAKIFKKGQMLEGEWKKASPEARTRFYANGSEVQLLPGLTWVQIVSPDNAVNVVR